jgi:hypothetical protein
MCTRQETAKRHFSPIEKHDKDPLQLRQNIPTTHLPSSSKSASCSTLLHFSFSFSYTTSLWLLCFLKFQLTTLTGQIKLIFGLNQITNLETHGRTRNNPSIATVIRRDVQCKNSKASRDGSDSNNTFTCAA